MDEFKEGKYKILLANIRCISMGFNLQTCHNMIFYSNTFSLEDRLQTEGRIWRTGQTNKCVYIDYIMNSSIDEKVYETLRAKKELKTMFE